MAGRDITEKQRRFAQVYVKTSNACEAYRVAYDVKKMSARAITVESTRLLQNPRVALVVRELQLRAQKRHDVTIETVTQMLKEDRAQAKELGMPAAAVTAVMGLAKLHGLIVDKKHITHKTDVSDITDAELAAIARGGSARAADEAEGAQESAAIH